MRRSWLVFKQIYSNMEQLQSERGVPFFYFRIKATKSEK